MIDPPPTTDPFGIDATLEDTNKILLSFNLTWDSNFNSEHAITSYTISIPDSTERRSMITCPHSCYPDDFCQCRGLMRGDNVTILVSAVNCGNQEGTPTRKIVASCMNIKLNMDVWLRINFYTVYNPDHYCQPETPPRSADAQVLGAGRDMAIYSTSLYKASATNPNKFRKIKFNLSMTWAIDKARRPKCYLQKACGYF